MIANTLFWLGIQLIRLSGATVVDHRRPVVRFAAHCPKFGWTHEYSTEPEVRDFLTTYYTGVEDSPPVTVTRLVNGVEDAQRLVTPATFDATIPLFLQPETIDG